LLGTLAAMLALYDLTRDELAEAGGLRAAFYLVIFPSGFFLAQVYTEGLFVGLAFSALALLRRKQLLLAGLLAAFATWTRAAGGLLVVPLALAWLGIVRGDGLKLNRKMILNTVSVLLPVAAYLLWNAALGTQFRTVEDGFFGRGLLLIERSWRTWIQTLQSLNQNPPPTTVYYLLELGGLALALVACLVTLRRYPGVALFGLGVLVLSVTSSIPQSMIRYVLAVPSVYIFLARLGRSTVFDRGWTTISVLLMGLLATLFTFDLWVA
ncbi:MAG TPA: hypothetical protein VHO69_05470, partial [Phototrophicaceae bacterium]|nr:hypothetical protein [Phototrophicaceae bacterium]